MQTIAVLMEKCIAMREETRVTTQVQARRLGDIKETCITMQVCA